MSEPHGHWVWDDQHGQVWCDAPDCDPLADAEHPHWKAREAMTDLMHRVAKRVNHTDGGLGLINSASVESDHYEGSLASIVWAVAREIVDPGGHAIRFWAEMGRLGRPSD